MARQTTHLWAEIQDWLDQLNWKPSQAKLAERLGLKSRSVITDWKYGASRPTPTHLEALAREMELTTGPSTYSRLVAAVMADLGYDVKPIRGEGVLTLRVADPDTREVYTHDQAEPGYEDQLKKIREDRVALVESDLVDTSEPIAADDTPGRDEEAEATDSS